VVLTTYAVVLVGGAGLTIWRFLEDGDSRTPRTVRVRLLPTAEWGIGRRSGVKIRVPLPPGVGHNASAQAGGSSAPISIAQWMPPVPGGGRPFRGASGRSPFGPFGREFAIHFPAASGGEEQAARFYLEMRSAPRARRSGGIATGAQAMTYTRLITRMQDGRPVTTPVTVTLHASGLPAHVTAAIAGLNQSAARGNSRGATASPPWYRAIHLTDGARVSEPTLARLHIEGEGLRLGPLELVRTAPVLVTPE